MTTRKAAVAGQFYPGTKKELESLIESIYEKEKGSIDLNLSAKNIIGGVVPHAGYVFSGYEAVHFFEIIRNSKEQYDTIIIINPNHTGYGSEIALDENEYWETPFGQVEIDKEFSNHLNLPVSELAHQFEHSAEVMIPFLQHFLDYEFQIVPITILSQNCTNSRIVAQAIYDANLILNKKILVLASSDFSHYVDPEFGRQLDQFVLNEILAFNSQKVYDTVRSKSISVCGYGPIMALIEYAKLVDPHPCATVLKKGNSGEVIPSSEVVDYVSILFCKE